MTLTQDALDKQMERLEGKRQKLAEAKAALLAPQEQVALESHKEALDAEEARVDAELKEALAASKVTVVRQHAPNVNAADQMAAELAAPVKKEKV